MFERDVRGLESGSAVTCNDCVTRINRDVRDSLRPRHQFCCKRLGKFLRALKVLKSIARVVDEDRSERRNLCRVQQIVENRRHGNLVQVVLAPQAHEQAGKRTASFRRRVDPKATNGLIALTREFVLVDAALRRTWLRINPWRRWLIRWNDDRAVHVWRVAIHRRCRTLLRNRRIRLCRRRRIRLRRQTRPERVPEPMVARHRERHVPKI